MTASAPNRGRRHTIRTVTRARELAAAGWNPADIRRLLIQDGYVDDVGKETVGRWVGEISHEAWRERVDVRLMRRAAERGRKPMGVMSARPEFKLARARTLRDQGLSFAAVAKVMSFDFREDVNALQLQYALEVSGRWPSRTSSEAAA